MQAPPRRTLLIGGGIAAFVMAAILVGLLMGGGEARDYDDEVRAEFLAVCTADGGEGVTETCVCLYDGIRAELDYDEFAELDAELAAAAEPGEPLELPDEVQAILDDCRGA